MKKRVRTGLALPSAVTTPNRRMQWIQALNARLGGEVTVRFERPKFEFMRVSGLVQALMVLGFRSHASGEHRGSMNVDGIAFSEKKGSEPGSVGFEPLTGFGSWEFKLMAEQALEVSKFYHFMLKVRFFV
ncbi:hypothetical protein L1987_05190 [Smallanthus sonchifolius]|uniref:Uncharacterized protein n=1 Tax=Smallanthus sonchifolius TaxID=185202 RepID=A0ACB9JUN7_9ASTR|nr:hypothetical protein L1987_05190 [Smallanthus sonchifolius]